MARPLVGLVLLLICQLCARLFSCRERADEVLSFQLKYRPVLFCVHNLLSFELFSLTISLALRDLLCIPLAQACSNDLLLSLSSLAALGNGYNRFRGLT
jgi:hypothetical protein